jgi:hypothetical protein
MGELCSVSIAQRQGDGVAGAGAWSSVGTLDLPYASDDLGNLLILCQKSLGCLAGEFMARGISSKGRHGTRNREWVFSTQPPKFSSQL